MLKRGMTDKDRNTTILPEKQRAAMARMRQATPRKWRCNFIKQLRKCDTATSLTIFPLSCALPIFIERNWNQFWTIDEVMRQSRARNTKYFPSSRKSIGSRQGQK
jgi:hypothetical protein